MDIFPFLRFVAMLKRNGVVKVDGSMLTVEFEERQPNNEENVAAYAPKFSKVRRLMEMHWYDRLPLWNCLTGLDEVKTDPDDMDQEYEGYKPSVERFGRWMYGLRQVAALFRIDPALWKTTSVKYLCILDALAGTTVTSGRESQSVPDL
jgi:hypothetical protein